MRKIILLSLCFITISLCTTTYGVEPYKNKQEFTIRWGFVDDEDWYDWSNSRIDAIPYNYYTPLDKYNNGKYYYDEKIYTQAITLSYTNEIKRWLALSINATYSGAFQNERETESGKITDKYRRHRIAVFPMVRFTYLNRPVVRLYSAVGFGFGMTKDGWSSNPYRESKTDIDGQLTFFGVSVGKKLFASWEVGIGSMGYFTMGGGYRF